MPKEPSDNVRLRRKTLAVFVAAAIAGIGTSAPAVAQQAQDVDEEVVVTGTRIRQEDPLSGPGPVLIIDEEQIRRTGLNTLGEVMQRLPLNGSTINTKFNSSGNFGFPPDGGGIGAGASLADLRYLGPKRTLVLVDGVRWVNESSASGVSSVVDLNTIPLTAVERIEVLADGASPIYGSDAIAGVVNVITKSGFDGLEVRAMAGGYDEGDGKTQELSISVGAEGETTSGFLNIAYLNQDEILAKDRAISAFPTPGLGRCTANCSSGTPQGRFFFNWPGPDGIQGTPDDIGVNHTINDGTTGIPTFDPLNPNDGGDYHTFTTDDRFNFSQFNLVLTPTKRYSIFGQGRVELTDQVGFFLRGLFNNRQSTNQAAPEPLFIGPNAGNGNLLDTINPSAQNPFNPYGITLGENDPTFFLGRRPLEGGPRVFNQNVDTFYLSGGLDGEFGQKNTYYWEFVGVYSQNRADQIKMGGYNSRKLQEGLGPGGTDPNNPGNLVCGVPDAMGVVQNPIPGCVPINLFGGQQAGGGSITQEMLDFFGFVQKDVSQQTLVDLVFNIGGDIVELPGGMMAFAAGLEHRELDGFFIPDSVVTAGESAGVPSSPTAGGFDYDEIYAELSFPVLTGVTAAQFLEFSVAGRNTDIKDLGDTTTGKFAMRWRPINDLLLRGTFAEGFRAPGIGEAFGQQSRFDQTIADPCSDMLGLSGGPPAPAQTVANCTALGVPADGSYVQFNQQISVQTGGNPSLKPEESETLTIGGVYDAGWAEAVTWADRFAVELNYYDIQLDGAIQAINASDQLEGCVNTLDPTLCGGINRTVTGVIDGFENQLTNIGGIETSGWDINFFYTSRMYNVGQFEVKWLNTLLSEYTEIIPTSAGFAQLSREGTEVGDPEQGFPEWKTNLILDWFSSGGDWNARFNLRGLDGLTEKCIGFTAFPGLCSNPDPADDQNSTNELDTTFYVDLQGSWTPQQFNGDLVVSVGINNVLDEEPPLCFSCALNGFDATLYDVPGRFPYLRVGYSFGRQ